MTHSYLEVQPKPDEIKTRIRGYGSWLEIDLDALSHNLAEIRHHTETEVMPCIKNNAYGHGLLPVAAHLADNGVKRFFVAKLKEALAIREHIGAGAVSMDPAWTDEQCRMIAEKGVTQVIYTLEAVECLSSVSLNHLLVDLRGTNAQINDVVEVISTSGENTLSKTAETAGWMVYSLLNHLNSTTPRVYIRGGEPTALLDSN